MQPPAAAAGTLPQSARRDFSGVSYDEAMRRARDCVPTLRGRAQASEDARVLLRESEQLLHEQGLFRFHQPKAFGCHHWLLGYYDPETQHEVWDRDPDTLIASSIALAAGRGRKTKDGFIVSGRWPFSSGVDNSDWNMLAVTIYGEDGKTAIDSARALMRDPLRRYLRDVQAANQHFSFNFDIAGAAFGMAALGGDFKHPTM